MDFFDLQSEFANSIFEPDAVCGEQVRLQNYAPLFLGAAHVRFMLVSEATL